MKSKIALIRKIEDDGKWLVTEAINRIALTKNICGKTVTVYLVRQSSDKLSIEFPSYVFDSTISHYAPKDRELRYSRNKVGLCQLVGMLHRTGLWDLIDNKDFFIINNCNKKSNKEELKKELKKILKE